MKHSFKGNVHRHVAIIMLLLLTTLKAVGQTFTLKGKVNDGDGNALELATVSCISQGKVTMTNLKGEFTTKASLWSLQRWPVQSRAR